MPTVVPVYMPTTADLCKYSYLQTWLTFFLLPCWEQYQSFLQKILFHAAMAKYMSKAPCLAIETIFALGLCRMVRTVAPAIIPTHEQGGQEIKEFKINIIYIVSFRLVWATWDPVSLRIKKKKRIKSINNLWSKLSQSDWLSNIQQHSLPIQVTFLTHVWGCDVWFG